jgi:hypothetical protein
MDCHTALKRNESLNHEETSNAYLKWLQTVQTADLWLLVGEECDQVVCDAAP